MLPLESPTGAPLRVLITGAGGFIGAALVRRLTTLGAEITAVARRPGRLDADANAYRYVPCDLRSVEQIRAVVKEAQPQLVFHLAAHPDGAEDCEHTQSVIQHNIVGLSHLLDALLTLPAVSLIYGDSAKVYGNGAVPYRSDQALESLSSYAVSKETGWRLIDVYRRVHGLQAAGLRPTLVYGPGQGFNLFTYLINAVNSGREEIALDGGAQTRDPLFIDDVIDAFIAAASHVRHINGMNLPIGGNREMSVAEITHLTVRLLGGRQKVMVRPSSVRPTETMRSWCDNSEAKALLNWSPSVSFEEGLLRTAGLSQPAAQPAMLVAQRENT
ncbi:NAD-dependent epimerase/dehydratase family protein [Roseateles sp. P5_E7]